MSDAVVGHRVAARADFAANGRRIIELDGIRGCACLLVVIGHYFGEVEHGLRFLRLEWVGVDLFFVLSGYLIGGILLDMSSSSANFAIFYTRRAFRIFPVYYLVVSLILLALPWFRQVGGAGYPPGLFFGYVQNFAMSFTGVETSQWLMPTWTLCVEEQFYLLLPAILFLTPPRLLGRVLLGLILSASLFRLALIANAANNLALHTLLPANWDLLFLGVVAAYAQRRPELFARLTRNNRFALQCGTIGGLGLFLALIVPDNFFGWRMVDVGGSFALGATFAAFLLLVADGAPEGRRFRAPALRFFGRISYSLYLIHQPVAGLMHALILGSRPDIGSFGEVCVTVASAAASIGLAQLSWVYVESPLIRLGHRWRYLQPA